MGEGTAETLANIHIVEVTFFFGGTGLLNAKNIA